MNKKIVFTGITPTGTVTLGHYLGIINNIKKMQKNHLIIIMIADLHALTTFEKNKKIDYHLKSKEIAAILYSCGLKKKNCKIFIQSEIKEHSNFSLLLSTFITVKKLNNMIQYKEKSLKHNNNLSLLSYPVLMASDVFLYEPDYVIVGSDQKQHCELITFLGKKINNIFSDKLLKIPEFIIPKIGSRIMGLKNPEKKMSKSDDDNISITEEKKNIFKKIKNAKTDSENKIFYDVKKKPGVSNLLVINSILKNKSIENSEKEFENKNYEELKERISNIINKEFEKIKKRNEKELTNIEKNLKKCKKFLTEKAKKMNSLLKKKMNIEK